MRKALSSVLAIALATCSPDVAARPVPPQSRSEAPRLDVEKVRTLFERERPLGFVPGELIIKLKTPVLGPPRVRGIDLQQVRPSSGGAAVYRVLGLEVLGANAAERTREAAAALQKEPNVAYADLNDIVHIAQAPNDALYAQQWPYRANGKGGGLSEGGIGIDGAWAKTHGSRDVVVAVLDTGLLLDHPDVKGSGNVIAGYDLVSKEKNANDGQKVGDSERDADPNDPGDASAAHYCYKDAPPVPDSWHGSHVAGIIGAVASNNGAGIAGVNWQVTIQPVRVLGRCGGVLSDINDAIRWAAGIKVDGVPENPRPAHVINVSAGVAAKCRPSTQEAIDEAVKKGVLVVAAAGNAKVDAAGTSPASCAGTLTVAAADAKGHLARYSNYGEVVGILAPGGDVEADADGDGQKDGVVSLVKGGYESYNGTSMAAPHVAGVAALVLARNAKMSGADLLKHIKATALQRNSTQCPRKCGAGLLDAAAALK